jgi:hypothetical protein
MADNVKLRRWVATILVVYLVVVGIAAMAAGIWAWRTWEQANAAHRVVSASLFGWHFNVSVESSIFLIVVSFGVLGGIVHSTNSLASYLGNRRFITSWAPWYALRPLIAAVLAMLAYVVFRGGFLSTTATAKDVNLFGVAAISGLAGLFSKQVIDKLEDVMQVVFASKANAERTGKLQPIVITGIVPDASPAGIAREVVIRGTGFGPGATVLVGDAERVPSAQGEGSVTVALTEEDVATARTLTLRIRSASGEVSDAVKFTVT